MTLPFLTTPQRGHRAIAINPAGTPAVPGRVPR